MSNRQHGRRFTKSQLRELAADGWTVTGTTGGGHVRLTHSTGAVYFTGSTPSDTNAFKMMRRDMRRVLDRRDYP